MTSTGGNQHYFLIYRPLLQVNPQLLKCGFYGDMLLVLGLSPLGDKQDGYRGNQNQECNELGDTHIATQ